VVDLELKKGIPQGRIGATSEEIEANFATIDAFCLTGLRKSPGVEPKLQLKTCN
jgi:hypothetical protein